MDSPRSRLSLLFVLLLLLISVSSSHSAASILEGTVVKIADGDTITVLDSNRQQHRVRIAGIDAPEKNQLFGNASRKRLGELVARKEVRIEFQKYDHYGRIVGKVWVTPMDCPTCGKTLDVGLAQITSGMAWWYRQYAHEQSAEDRGAARGGPHPSGRGTAGLRCRSGGGFMPPRCSCPAVQEVRADRSMLHRG
jgi:endonuclease YncB( thermonuclease family)